MSNTIKNEARGLGGLEAGQKGLSSYSINKKKTHYQEQDH